MHRWTLFLIWFVAWVGFADPLNAEQTNYFNAVIASVAGEAITLSDLSKKLTVPRPLDWNEFKQSPELKQAAEALIFERLIEAEARSQNVEVSETETAFYVNEVAKRNGLTLAEFKAALQKENKDFERYQLEVRQEIMRSKLGSRLARESVSVSSEEIDHYFAEHPELKDDTNVLKLRRILLSITPDTLEERREKAANIVSQIRAGADFGSMAAQHSDAPEASGGGALGLIPEQNLQPPIRRALADLQAGESSDVIESQSDLQIFLLERRFTTSDEDRRRLEQEAADLIRVQKSADRLRTFLTSEIYDRHSVERNFDS